MLDNQLIQVFLPIINSGLATYGYIGVTVLASNQPTQQGIPTGPTVYFYKLNDHRLGFLRRFDEWDGVNMIHTEEQQYETTFQVNSLVIQKPLTPNEYTASDLVNDVCSIMQSDSTREILYNNGISILRITDVTNGYFVDDKDNFEASPSFDFTLSYTRTKVSTGNVIDHVEFDVNRV
jgi:hypothetical protein